MKKTILLSLLCVVAMITACKDENERDIVGTWVYEKHLYELLENGSVKDVVNIQRMANTILIH